MVTLRWINAGLLLFGAAMFVCMGVVCILYGVYLDEAPRLREDFPMLLRSTGLFAVLAVAAGLAFYGLQRAARWRWAAQGVLAVTALLIAALQWRLLTGE